MRRITESIILFLVFGISLSVTGQYKLNNDLSAMYIDGTSSLHDWTETVEQMSGTLNLVLNGSVISKVSSVKAIIPVRSIKSGKGAMDENTYKALKVESHPQIFYTLKSYAMDGDEIRLTGELTIAGVTRDVKFKATYVVTGEFIKFSGAHAFFMTDFDVDPPTAVMGTIKTGDKVIVRMELVFSKIK